MNLPNSNYLQVLILGGSHNGIVIVKGGVGEAGNRAGREFRTGSLVLLLLLNTLPLF
tara:strand:- start:1400 stop:1570 length:171 start_codon:yes stop_codon:yes gene_type:complete